VGVSFELGALVDGTPPSTREILIDSIMRYFGIPPTRIIEDRNHDATMPLVFDIYPNPARDEVRIALSTGSMTKNTDLQIYDITGRCVRSFTLQSEICNLKLISWDCTDHHGRKVAQGIYFVHITAEDRSLTKKFVLLK
jgi:hypothetical protein